MTLYQILITALARKMILRNEQEEVQMSHEAIVNENII